LEAFLACPVKCHLLSKQELPEGTEYSTWAIVREDSCRQATVRKLTIPETKPYIASPEPGVWKSESWQFAVAKTVRTEGWEAEIAMIQQIPQAGSLSRFVSIHFVANNKLSSSEKTIAAFEAIVLAKALGRKTDKAKIVYGEKQAMLTVNAAALSRSVHRKVAQVVAMLDRATRPDTVINRHCPECGFNDRCRKDAVAKDDLSLLSNLNEKERARYRGKGIFTVSQMAYTFRPRRRSKRLASRPER
jgi:predicted RecB family nuclease